MRVKHHQSVAANTTQLKFHMRITVDSVSSNVHRILYSTSCSTVTDADLDIHIVISVDPVHVTLNPLYKSDTHRVAHQSNSQRRQSVQLCDSYEDYQCTKVCHVECTVLNARTSKSSS